MHDLEPEQHVLGGDRVAVRERGAAAQVEGPREPVGADLPRLRELADSRPGARVVEVGEADEQPLSVTSVDEVSFAMMRVERLRRVGLADHEAAAVGADLGGRTSACRRAADAGPDSVDRRVPALPPHPAAAQAPGRAAPRSTANAVRECIVLPSQNSLLNRSAYGTRGSIGTGFRQGQQSGLPHSLESSGARPWKLGHERLGPALERGVGTQVPRRVASIAAPSVASQRARAAPVGSTAT